MIERDDELKGALDKWETPSARPVLDARVWHGYHQLQRRKSRWKIFGAIAAVAVLTVGVAQWPSSRPLDDKADWRPLPNGAITVVKVR